MKRELSVILSSLISWTKRPNCSILSAVNQGRVKSPIQKHFMSYLDSSFDLIHDSQSGFRAGHSTETALLLITERWLKALNDGKVVGSVMVDFRKAFDLVDHTLHTLHTLHT